MRPARLVAHLADDLPSPDEARSRLGRELLRPEYHEEDLLARIIDAGRRLFDQLVTATAATSLGSLVLALVIAFALVLALVVVGGRLRRQRALTGQEAGPALPEHRLSAAEHRAAAESALAAGRYADCVAEAFRAAVLRPVEAGRIVERPGATATELAAEVAALENRAATPVPAHLGEVARDFNSVVYGHRPATRAQADGAMALDDLLAGSRR